MKEINTNGNQKNKNDWVIIMIYLLSLLILIL